MQMTTQNQQIVAIVDDDEAVRDSLSVVLMLNGMDAPTFGKGAEFLASLASGHPDVLVVDMHMPEMSGLDLVRQLNLDGNRIPTILISGNLSQAVIEQARQLDVLQILKKPFTNDELLMAITDAIA